MKDGGPAFPQQMLDTESGRFSVAEFGCGGMSLRDWFAGLAMQGDLSATKDAVPVELEAGWAYQMADAMLARRDKPLDSEPNG